MISWNEVLIRLSLAALFGGIIGLERERKDWAAGLRTHMMVSVGASLAMIVSAYGFADVLGNPNIELDPSRIAAQVISGIGFIGAGAILLLRQGMVRGLTTASGLWTVAAIGLATGGGLYFAALVTTVLAIIILWGLQPLEKKLGGKFKQKSIRIVTISKDKSISIIGKIFMNENWEISGCIVDKEDIEFIITVTFRNIGKQDLTELMNHFQLDTDIKEVVWSN
ncbi:MAG: MgtC/SapB family protein [Bacteroidetes bacterium]|nr:MgtC/SapB family protein [Bacteroidota bacterium]